MNLRKLIREAIGDMFQGDESGTGPLIGDTLTNIQQTLDTDLQNVNSIVQTHTVDMKNKDNEIKANLELKSKLDQNNPHKKGLEREIPEDQKDYENRKKQLKDLQDAVKGMISAKDQIEKQKQELEKQSLKTATQDKSGKKQPIASVLPSLESPI